MHGSVGPHHAQLYRYLFFLNLNFYILVHIHELADLILFIIIIKFIHYVIIHYKKLHIHVTIMINEYSDELSETPFKRNFGNY